MESTKDITILYHANCLDGFGGAYGAWKKLGDTANYVPVYHGEPMPDGLDGKTVYVIDFSYPSEALLGLEKKAKRLVVLDHHSGTREAVEAVAEHVFDNEHSGSTIAWSYFHPGKPTPRLLAYIEDGDLWRNSLPYAKEVAAYLSTIPFDFEKCDTLTSQFEDDAQLVNIISKGTAYREYFDYACDTIIEQAEEVSFEGFTILSVNAPRLFRSEIGNRLAKRHGPFSIVWYPNHDMWHFSLRGDGSIDLSEIARRYGGNGHHDAASFGLPFNQPFPFHSN